MGGLLKKEDDENDDHDNSNAQRDLEGFVSTIVSKVHKRQRY